MMIILLGVHKTQQQSHLFLQITADDVDFQHKDPQQLCLEEQHGMYPPKFTIRAHSLSGAGNAKVRFNFRGGDKRIAMDILLLLTEGVLLVGVLKNFHFSFCIKLVFIVKVS